MLNIFSLGYVVWKKTDDDIQFGQTSAYTNYQEALSLWKNYHAGPLVTSFGIPLQDYLYDVQPNFEIYAIRNNLPINALNFWIFATGQHITEALERLNVDTSTLQGFQKYVNVMKNHVEGALLTHDTKTKANLLTVLDSTIEKTADDIRKMAKKAKDSLDPTESILPFVLLGVAFLWLTK